MGQKRLRKWARWGLLVLPAILLLPVFFPSVSLYLEDKLERHDGRLSRHLQRQGVNFLLTFDRPGGREWVSGRAPQSPGVEVIVDEGGYAARFSGTRWSAIHTPVSWRVAGSDYGYSLLVRIKLLPPSATQEIMFYAAGPLDTGFKLENGNIRWYLPGAADQVLSYPFERWGEYVDIAGTFDPSTGRAELYENGELKSAGKIADVNFPRQGINFGLTRWYAARHPLHAVLAGAAIWNRPLPGTKIARLSRSRSPLLGQLAPIHRMEMKFWESLSRAVGQVLRFVDYLHPGTYSRHPELPEIRLQLRSRPLRDMNLAHSRSRQSGRRTADGARFRNVLALVDGRLVRGTIALAGSDTSYGSSSRKSFNLELLEPVLAGLKRIRLIPPEDAGWTIPLLDTALADVLGVPGVRNGLCRLYLNGIFSGIYYYEDDARRGVSSQTAESFLHGPDNPNHWLFPFQRQAAAEHPPRGPARQGIPLPAGRIEALYRELEAHVSSLFANDRSAPFNRRDLRRVLRELRGRIGEIWTSSDLPTPAEQAAAYLVPELVLGGNPSAYYIREDLELDIFPIAGLEVRWTSSRPDLISPTGSVSPPEGDFPVEVELTAVFSAGAVTVKKPLTFRVMPVHPRLPALMFYVREALQKTRRVDTRIEYYPADVFSPVEYRAFQGEEGGIKFRGNTSFWQSSRGGAYDWTLRKIPFSVRCEEAHGILGVSGAKHFYLGSGYSDISMMRNKFAYDLFKAMGTGETRPNYAPDVFWAEVFVNGDYRGLYELTSRVDRYLVGWDRYDPEQADPAVLYKIYRFGEECAAALTVSQPPEFYGMFCEPYRELIDFINEASPEDFARGIEQKVNPDAVIDWQLLVNYTDNRDGVNANMFLARAAGDRSRFFIIPWDYDATFYERRPAWLSNALANRFWWDYPGYRKVMAARWHDLRQGPLRDETVAARLEAMENRLEGYMQWDYRIWDGRYSQGVTLGEASSALRRQALSRLSWMDARFSEAPGAN